MYIYSIIYTFLLEYNCFIKKTSTAMYGTLIFTSSLQMKNLEPREAK